MTSGMAADRHAVRDRDPLPRRPRLRGDARLAVLAVGLLIIGAVASGAELLAAGSLTPPVLALDLIGGTMLPYGLLAMLLPSRPDADAGEDGEDGGGGGGRGWDGARPEPLPPTGGLEIDWGRFEEEFRAYAQSVTTVGSPT